jgi:rare lipoprotein A
MSVAPPPKSSPRRRPGPSDFIPLARLALILTLITLLSACGGSHPTPSRGNGSTSRPSSSSVAPTRRGGVNDDVSRSQSSRYSSSNDSVPDDNLDVSKLVEPTPKVEPHSQYGNKSPYAVNGRSYTVLPDASGYVERGIASFYGSKFHGYKTSNFEEYDMYQFSAAHKTLPLPSYARVTNLENGKSVIVRINDRGPFHEYRIIDLS